jgi:LacI family transcriptional regulator
MPDHRPIRVAVVTDMRSGFGQAVLSGCARWLTEHPRADVWATKADLSDASFDLGPFDGVLYHRGSPTFERRLRRFAKPVVNTSANSPYIPPNSVLSDDRAAARLAIEHFLDRGRTGVGLLTVGQGGYHQRRATAFAEAARARRVNPIVFRLPTRWTDASWAGLVEQVRRRAGSLGVFTTDNQLAERFLVELARAGVPIPDDVAVVGIGNETNLCEFCHPPLSSVDTAFDLRGYHGLDRLVAQVKGSAPMAQPLYVQPRGVIIRASSDLSAAADPDVRAALRFIRDHSQRSTDVADVVAASGVTRRALEGKFRKHLGRTVHQEIWRAHLQLARHLLVNSDIPIATIATRSGYGTMSNLSTLFRRATGLAPNEFRRKHRDASTEPPRLT